MCLRVLICAQGVILMNSKHITNYKPKDFAELLGVSVKTLQRWDRENILKAKRTPTDRKYKKKIKRDEEIAKSLQSRDKTNNKTNTKNQSKYWSLLDGYIMNIYQRTINYILNTKMDSLIRNRCL